MIERVLFIDILKLLNLPTDQYLITGASWLALMNIRKNSDIDLIISPKIKEQVDKTIFTLKEQDRKFVESYIDKSPKHGRKQVAIAKAKDFDDLINNYFIVVDGYRFVHFDIYYKYKKGRKRPNDITDLKAIKSFFKHKKNTLSEYSLLF